MKDRITLLLLLFTLFLQLHTAHAESSSLIADGRASYEDDLADITLSQSTAIRGVNTAYLKALKKHSARVQKTGDLDALTIVKKEIDRFSSERVLAETDMSNSSADLLAIQKAHCGNREKADGLGYKKVLSLTDSYIEKVNALKRKLSQSGDLDTAYKASKEVKRVGTTKAVTEARLWEANGGASIVEKKQEVAKKAPSGLQKAKRVNGVAYIYGAGQKPPVKKGRRFGRIMLRPTGLVLSKDSKVTVSASSSAQLKNVTEDDDGEPMKLSIRRTTVRLQLKYSKSGVGLSNINVKIQCFVNTTSKGKVKPLLLKTCVVPLDYLNKTIVSIDTYPVTTQKYSEVGAGSSKRGQDFYGILVSVFDDQGVLVHQSMSMPGLKDLASGKL